MTVAELILALMKHPYNAKVVIDVNADQCQSDRNVLDISEARLDAVDDDISWVFIQAIGNGAQI